MFLYYRRNQTQNVKQLDVELGKIFVTHKTNNELENGIH